MSPSDARSKCQEISFLLISITKEINETILESMFGVEDGPREVVVWWNWETGSPEIHSAFVTAVERMLDNSGWQHTLDFPNNKIILRERC
jgi:hypothetical protein